MEITRGLSVDGTFSPVAVNFLDQIPADALFHMSHQLRHPASIYRLSLENVAEAFCRVAEEYLLKIEEYGARSSDDFEIFELLSSQLGLLRAMQEHIDDCWLILKTLVDPRSATKTSRFTDQYVVASGLAGAKAFRNAIADFKSDLRIANKLKHQQGRLRGVAMWLPARVHIGYFLEEPDPQGFLGPSPEIHSDQGAISFARDLTWHLFNAYLCSERLVAAVKTALGGRGISIQHQPCAPDKNWDKAVSLALSLPTAFFPKEVRKGIAGFHCDASGQVLTVRCPERVQVTFPSPVKITCCTRGDGHSVNFRVPFP